MRKNISLILSIAILSFLFLAPAVFADSTSGLVPCTGVDATGTPTCHFSDLLVLVSRVINFVVYALILPIAAIIFAYTGFLFLTSGGSPETKTKAKDILLKAVIGLIIILAAWLIVAVILGTLGVPDTFRLMGAIKF